MVQELLARNCRACGLLVSVPCEKVVNGAFRNAEFAGRLGLVFTGSEIGLDECVALRFLKGGAAVGSWRRGYHAFAAADEEVVDILFQQLWLLRKGGGAFEHVLKLADVSWPIEGA